MIFNRLLTKGLADKTGDCDMISMARLVDGGPGWVGRLKGWGRASG